MSFFTSCFSCCLGESENEKVEAEARHARIMSMYVSDQHTPASPIAVPPPCYADITRDRPFFLPEEKSLPIPEHQTQHEPQYPTEARRSSISSGSSVVSVPSTRLSDLTSMHTGRTRRARTRDGDEMSERNGSRRGSVFYEESDSAPPSYYAGSERSLTPGPDPLSPPPALIATQHPVMQEEWWANYEAQRMRYSQQR